MKKILFLILLLWSAASYGQNPTNYQYRPVRERSIAQMIDSGFHLPRYNGTPSGLRVGVSVQDGAVAIDTANGRLYIYQNGSWIRLARYTEATGGGVFVDTIFRTPGVDSIYFTINSTQYAIKDSSGGTLNTNIGSGYRLLKPAGQEIKTIFNGYAVQLDSTSNTDGITLKADTFNLATRAWRQKGIDSLAALIPAAIDTSNKWIWNQYGAKQTANSWYDSTKLRKIRLANIDSTFRDHFSVGGTDGWALYTGKLFTARDLDTANAANDNWIYAINANALVERITRLNKSFPTNYRANAVIRQVYEANEDTATIYSVGGDLGSSLHSEIHLMNKGGNGTHVFNGGATVTDAVPVAVADLQIWPKSGTTPTLKANGYWSGFTSYKNFGASVDLQHWISYLQTDYAFGDYETHTGIYLNNPPAARVSTRAYSLYTPDTVARMVHGGSVHIGPNGYGTHTAPTLNGAVDLELSSTNKGFLPNRLTTAQRTSITTPPNSSFLFDTDLSRYMGYISGSWKSLAFTTDVTNLATDNLTQDAEARTYNLNGQNLSFINSGNSTFTVDMNNNQSLTVSNTSSQLAGANGLITFNQTAGLAGQLDVTTGKFNINLSASTNLAIDELQNQGSAATRFLVYKATDDYVKFRTAAEVLSDIGAQASGNYITGLTGDVTATGPGSVAATIANDAVSYAKFQNVGANEVLGRAAGTSGDISGIAIGASQLFGRGASGDLTAITLGSNLSMSGTTLNASGSGSPGGSNKQVQYNNSGAFGGAAGFEVGNTNNRVKIEAQATTEVPLEIKMAASQTADPFQIKNSSDVIKAYITKDGYGRFPSGDVSNAGIRVGDYPGLIEAGGGYLLGILEANGYNTAIGNSTIQFKSSTGSYISFGNAGTFGTSENMRLLVPDAGTLQLMPDAAVPVDVIIQGNKATATNTNQAGATLYIKGIPGTGNSTANGGILFQTPDAGASGTTVQSLTTKMQIMRDGTIEINEITAPGTPSSGFGRIYEKTDGKLYFKNDAGTETELTNVAGGSAHTIRNEGSNLTARTGLNFIGSAVNAGDDAGGDESEITFDAEVNGIADLATNGIVARTASGTFSGRTITGTSNEITLADGDGVSGNPTISLSSTLALGGKTITVQDNLFTIRDDGDNTKTGTFNVSNVPTGTGVSWHLPGVTAPLSYYSAISPSNITSDQDNYNPTGWDDATIIRVTGDATFRAITSFTAPSATSKPQSKTIINVGSNPIYIPAEHPDGTAANRVDYFQDFVLYPKQAVVINYDATSSRWRILGENNIWVKNAVSFSVAAGSVTAGDHGELAFAQTGTGAAAAALASTTSLPAAHQLGTGTTTTGLASLYFGKSVNTIAAFGSGHMYAEALVSIPTLSDGTETHTCYLLITNSPQGTTAEPNNSVFIRYSNGINSGKWQLVSQDNGGTESTADLGITVSSATRYLLRIEIDEARSEVRAYIDGAFAGRVTGNMPNAVVAGPKVTIVKSAGTTSRTFNVHSFSAGAIY